MTSSHHLAGLGGIPNMRGIACVTAASAAVVHPASTTAPHASQLPPGGRI